MAKARHRWDDDDDLRPLTHRGRTQAEQLVEQLAAYEVARVFSSPSVRCVDTVAPLAESHGLEVVMDPRLAEGNGHRAVQLVGEMLAADEDVALCSHGDVIPEVLEALGYAADR